MQASTAPRRLVLSVIALLLAGLLASSCTPLLPGSVAGVVRDPAGNPLGGVVLTLATPTSAVPAATSVTDANGGYTFATVPGRVYRLGTADPAGVHRETWWPRALVREGGADLVVNGSTITADIVMSCAGEPPLAACARAPSTITVTVSPVEVHPGETQRISIVVPTAPGGPVPTGTFAVVGLGAPIALVDGGLATEVTLPFAGSWSFPVAYSGDAFYAPATVPLGVTVLPGMTPFVGSGPKVAVMGDSITYWARPAIDGRLAAAGYNRSVTGQPGAHTLSLQWLVDAYAQAGPDVFVLNLGTNDVSEIVQGIEGHSLSQFKASVLETAARFPQACVVVTTLSTQRTATSTTTYAERNALAAEVNGWLAATFPHVIDWDRSVRDAAGAGTALLGDEVHPNEAGSAALGQLVLDQVDSCTGRNPTG